jgi:molecular chaperone GrpE
MRDEPVEETNEEDIENLKKRLKDTDEKAERYLNQLKYAKADLENLQKNTQRRIEQIIERANGRLLGELLPITDELDLAIQNVNSTKNPEFYNGLQMVKKKLNRLLELEGVKPIDTEGKSFDPHLHEALLEVETTDYPNGSIVEEIRKGYTYNNRVLRASIVKIAKNIEINEV